MTSLVKNQVLLYGSLFLLIFVVFLYFAQNYQFIKRRRTGIIVILLFIFASLFLIVGQCEQIVINVDSFLIEDYSIINLNPSNSEPFGIKYKTAAARRIEGLDWFYKILESRSIQDRGIWITYRMKDPKRKERATEVNMFFFCLQKRGLDMNGLNSTSSRLIWDNIFMKIRTSQGSAFPVLNSILEKVDVNSPPELIEELFNQK